MNEWKDLQGIFNKLMGAVYINPPMRTATPWKSNMNKDKRVARLLKNWNKNGIAGKGGVK
jgi:hypothetical protein